LSIAYEPSPTVAVATEQWWCGRRQRREQDIAQAGISALKRVKSKLFDCSRGGLRVQVVCSYKFSKTQLDNIASRK